jgi:large subunit ribosomal protein L20
MARVKRGVMHTKRRRNILKAAKGFKWGRKNRIKLAKTAVVKAGVYAYRDRQKKKSEFRSLWQVRMSAALKPYGISYSKFIHALKVKNIELDRKILATLAKDHPVIFKAVVKEVKAK